MDQIELLRPADWHLHVRQGEAMRAVVPASAAVFAQALVMPNLKPPVTTTAAALAYREEILAAARAAGGRAASFVPWMTLYLTEATAPQEIDRAVDSGAVLAAKLYPAGATTNSDAGVRRIERIYPVLERMQERGLVLCVHGEVVDPEVDIFDREAVFVERVLAPLVARFPGLKVVLEHVTTAEGVAFVREAPETVAATLTAHHLRYERNAMLAGGIRPHFYCLPILKRERHRRALVEAATSGSPKFFLGTDSAPHPRGAKESACGCAGCYTAPLALPLYAEVFEAAGALDRLEGFASRFGARFYGVAESTERIALVRRPWTVPAAVPLGEGEEVVPLRAGETMGWMVE
jgi:dihydroorotase